MKKCFIAFCILFLMPFSKSWSSVLKSNSEFLFLQNMNDMRADFTQKQYDGEKYTRSYGKISIKKPNSILLEHNGSDMKLKLLSVNGNLKMFDEDLGQTTYVDNQYNALMKFFTSSLTEDMLSLNLNNELCLQFDNIGNKYEACLKIDLKQKTIKYIDVFLIIKDNEISNKIESYRKFKKYQIMNIQFRNVIINKGIDDKEFLIKDNRIFDDNDD